jgi:hypothetical protein
MALPWQKFGGLWMRHGACLHCTTQGSRTSSSAGYLLKRQLQKCGVCGAGPLHKSQETRAALHCHEAHRAGRCFVGRPFTCLTDQSVLRCNGVGFSQVLAAWMVNALGVALGVCGLHGSGEPYQ